MEKLIAGSCSWVFRPEHQIPPKSHQKNIRTLEDPFLQSNVPEDRPHTLGSPTRSGASPLVEANGSSAAHLAPNRGRLCTPPNAARTPKAPKEPAKLWQSKTHIKLSWLTPPTTTRKCGNTSAHSVAFSPMFNEGRCCSGQWNPS